MSEQSLQLDVSFSMACPRVDRQQLFNLLTGMFGIYTLYGISGVLHEKLLKSSYNNVVTGKWQLCEYPFGLILVPNLIAWLMGELYVRLCLGEVVEIPHKNAALTGLAAASASFCSVLAIERTSYPVIMMMESSSILPVIFVAVFCSRVTDAQLKLGPQKLIVAAAITTSILIFEFSDTGNHQRETTQQFLGLFFVLGFFIADGFLPDLQAEIKIKWKPQPLQMMAVVNRWATFWAFVGMVFVGDSLGYFTFMVQHPLFSVQMLVMSFLSGIGQFFIYRMIKQFKQHFVPFTITSRKILTVVVSILFMGHPTNIIQLLGIAVVLGTVVIEFLWEISRPVHQSTVSQNGIELNEQLDTNPQTTDQIKNNALNQKQVPQANENKEGTDD